MNRFKKLKTDLDATRQNADKLTKDDLLVKKERDDAREDVRSFQGALEVRTMEKVQALAEVKKLKVELVETKAARAMAEQKVKMLNKNLMKLKNLSSISMRSG